MNGVSKVLRNVDDFKYDFDIKCCLNCGGYKNKVKKKIRRKEGR